MNSYTGYAGLGLYRVINRNGAMVVDHDGSPLGGPGIPYGTVIMGIPRGDGYLVEVTSGDVSGCVHVPDLQLQSPSHTGMYVGDAGTGCPPGMVPVLHQGQWTCIPSLSGLPPFTGGPSIVGDGACPPGTVPVLHQGQWTCVPSLSGLPPFTGGSSIVGD